MSADRAARIAGMRKLLDILEANPDLNLPHVLNTSADFYGLSKAQMAALASAIPGPWDKHAWDARGGAHYFELRGALDGLQVHLNAERDEVCTRVVTGTENREVEEVVTPAVTRKVVKPVETVRWECGSLLAPAGGDPEVTR